MEIPEIPPVPIGTRTCTGKGLWTIHYGSSGKRDASAERGDRMDRTTLLREKREEILRIAARHGARNVRLFGSVARGEADEHSDIDLLVSFDPESSLLHHAALIRELREFLGLPVDVVDDEGIRPRMRDRVLSEATPL
jgi:uncharacterized protein